MRHFHEPAGPAHLCLKEAEIDPSLDAIRCRKEGPVNWRAVARDARGSWSGEIMDNRHRARRPSYRALVEADGLYFRRLYRAAAGLRRDEKWENRGTPYPRLRPGGREGGRSGAAAVGRDFVARITDGAQMANRRCARRPSFWPLIAQVNGLSPTPLIRDLITSKGGTGEIALYGLGVR